MKDLLEKIGNSIIQHGKSNERIYLMKYDSSDLPLLIRRFNELIQQNNYSKIFIKITKDDEEFFIKKGFSREALIPSFYENDDCCFMAKYYSEERKNIDLKDELVVSDVLKIANSKRVENPDKNLNSDFYIKILSEERAEELALLYKNVFNSYPFPIFEVNYILETMKNNLVYFGCFKGEKLIAASSSEIDIASKSVEMTDFATDSNYHGNNISLFLLRSMEKEMQRRGIRTAYTIARALSYGMNITFKKSGYVFGGTLINNTHISGKIENMNVWYKDLQKHLVP